MKLNIGSGYKKIPGFLNVDSSPDCKPDFVVNLEKDMFPFEDSSVNEVIAHHVLEHLGEGFFHCMRELYRVCADGAIIQVAVPHPRHDTFLMDPTHRRPIYPHTLRMFSRKRNMEQILTNGNETPIAIINKVDFEVIAERINLDPYYEEMFKTISEDQQNYILRSYNNVSYTIDVILKVVKDESIS